jgi:oxygen-independent coproporphyrinogen-3 oxidase
VYSVFIGGGTPSLFAAAVIGRLLEGIDARIGLAGDAEITLEANPGTAEASRFVGYRAAGVNRLSIGVQSLEDTRLRALGRIHSAREARDAVTLARAVGFDNLNLDLMFGLPGQTEAGALADLHALIDLGPDHVSWYQLTLEPNTLFHQRPPAGLPDDDRLGDIMQAGQALLAASGFHQYEISAYARDGRACRHNRNYWEFGDYLGVGAGAHGKLTGPDGEVVRSTKRRAPAAYLRAAAQGATSTRAAVPRDDLPLEFMLNALRLNCGVSADFFEARTGLPLGKIAVPLARARGRGLMQDDARWLAPTQLGQCFLNDLLALFDPD